VKSAPTVIGSPQLVRANASAALAYIYRPAIRRKIAARPRRLQHSVAVRQQLILIKRESRAS
jgi:hypothetical protein